MTFVGTVVVFGTRVCGGWGGGGGGSFDGVSREGLGGGPRRGE